jgi:hypothetical protein
MARRLEGLARNAGKHAGGVVIAPGRLTDFTPLYCEPDGSNLVTQFDKDDVEAAGLVKFDFLGLRTLTIIDWAVNTVNGQRVAAGEPPIDIAAIPTDDRDAFALLKRAETTAVFQLESGGIKQLIKPSCSPIPSTTSRRWSPCTGRGRCNRAWSMTSSPASTACRRSCIHTRILSRSWHRPMASSSTRSR